MILFLSFSFSLCESDVSLANLMDGAERNETERERKNRREKEREKNRETLSIVADEKNNSTIQVFLSFTEKRLFFFFLFFHPLLIQDALKRFSDCELEKHFTSSLFLSLFWPGKLCGQIFWAQGCKRERKTLGGKSVTCGFGVEFVCIPTDTGENIFFLFTLPFFFLTSSAGSSLFVSQFARWKYFFFFCARISANWRATSNTSSGNWLMMIRDPCLKENGKK